MNSGMDIRSYRALKLEVDPDGSGFASQELRAHHVVEALQRRGVAATAETAVSEGVPIADVILSMAADLSADMLVMGAWGH